MRVTGDREPRALLPILCYLCSAMYSARAARAATVVPIPDSRGPWFRLDPAIGHLPPVTNCERSIAQSAIERE